MEQPGTDAWTRTWAYRLIQSVDFGATWSTRVLPDGDIWVSLRAVTDHGYILSTDPDDPMRLQLLTISKDGIRERSVRFPGTRAAQSVWPPDVCQAPDRLWWVYNSQVYTLGEDDQLRALPGVIEYDESKRTYQFLCGKEHAAIHSNPIDTDTASQDLHYQACDVLRCTPPISSTAHAKETLVHHVFHSQQWHTVQYLDGVLALWRGSEPTPYKLVHLSSEAALKEVISWGNLILFFSMARGRK